MKDWSSWQDIESAKSKGGNLNDFGIYEIRVVNRNKEAIPICRFVGRDSQGLIYIGRSGYRWQKTGRTIANRIKEFAQQQHSGGIAYARIQKVLAGQSEFSGHRLEARGVVLPDEEINKAEINAIDEYFSMHAELPPCNSAFPKAVK